jgi:hypothetical protein
VAAGPECGLPHFCLRRRGRLGIGTEHEAADHGTGGVPHWREASADAEGGARPTRSAASCPRCCAALSTAPAATPPPKTYSP